MVDLDGIFGATTFRSPLCNPCVDLQTVYGSRFKIRREADGVTWTETPEPERVWLLELPCRHGVIYPQGGDILAATITSRRIGNQVATLPGIRSSRGDIERVVIFHLNDADAVLELLRPHRRRQISPEERARLAAIGHRHRFRGAHPLENDPRIDAAVKTALGPTPGLPDAGDDMKRAAVRPTDIANSLALSVKQVPHGCCEAARARMGDA